MNDELWIWPDTDPEQQAKSIRLVKEAGIRPGTADILCARGIDTPEKAKRYLHPQLGHLYDAHLLKNAEEAACLLKQKIEQHARIRVIGDYDIDGVCASYILLDSLRECGADVDYTIPDRMTDGYGLNERLIQDAVNDGIDTIVTCDNGIAASEQIQMAADAGMTVIVTDHHEVPTDEEGKQIFPSADVVVDPSRADETYPFCGICGAVVAWKVMQLLYIQCGMPKRILHNLSFAAFATIGDVMDLRDENRVIVHFGLQALSRTENPGMRALIRQTGVLERTGMLSAYHVGFILGPCMNAAGRLETAVLALSMLLEPDETKAKKNAARLIELNTRRQDLTKTGLDQAILACSSPEMAEDKVLTIYLPDVSESIAGIIAGKVREQTGKPCFILTDAAAQEGMLKGSGRSIPEYNMFDGISSCKDLLSSGGGHPMAAGISIRKEKLQDFRIRLNAEANLSVDDVRPKQYIDAVMPVNDISAPLVRELKALEPCGKGNEKPLFADEQLQLISARVLGARRNVLKMVLSDQNGFILEAVSFRDPDGFMEHLRETFGDDVLRSVSIGRGRQERVFVDIVYEPDINVYRGQETIQAIVRSLRWSGHDS